MMKMIFENPVVWVFTLVFVLELGFLLYTAGRPTKGNIALLMVAEAVTLLAAIGSCRYYDHRSFLYCTVFLFTSLIFAAFFLASAAVCATRYATCHPMRFDKDA